MKKEYNVIQKAMETNITLFYIFMFAFSLFIATIMLWVITK